MYPRTKTYTGYTATMQTNLPNLTQNLRLKMHPDARGTFTELYRQEWDTSITPIQWNLVQSNTNVLRGVHVHIKHWDYLIISSGSAIVGLRDLRQHSPTFEQTVMVKQTGEQLCALIIPPGVAHGFYFLEPSTHIYAVSEYWNMQDELGCHWADPALEMDFTVQQPMLSARDSSAKPFALLMEQLEPMQKSFVY
jgi:dTDP-4-dehydrorhamnose 3,5-epimerase